MSARRPGEVMGHTTRGAAWETRQSWFMLLFLTGVGYWLPLVYMGLRVLQVRWVVYGLLYAIPGALAAIVWASGGADAGAARWVRGSAGAFWLFALFHTWSARGEFLVRLAEQHYDQEDLVERSRIRMEAATETGGAEAPPAPRRLLNINRVTEAELALLPGLGPERAREALRLREQMGDFRSFADFAVKLQLTAPVIVRLRPLFEPDSEAVGPVIADDDPAYRRMPDGSRLLELNWASAEALDGLPGMETGVAQRAVALREGDGPFKSLEDFRYRLNLPMDVMIKISPFVSVSSASTRPGGGGAPRAGGRIVDV